MKGKLFKDMTLDELREELEYWRAQLAEAKGWGAAVGAAAGFHAACKVEIERREAAVVAHTEAQRRP